MKSVISSDKHLPIKLWLDPANLEESALEQAIAVASLPKVFKHVALMPDAHMGFGVPIGTVVAFHGLVAPSIVGVDIGCGMAAMKTNIKASELTLSDLRSTLGVLRLLIPVGFNKQNSPQVWDGFDEVEDEEYPVIFEQLENARKQLGTLGGGNHFIELQVDQEGWLWAMIHSGSRNLGKQVADYYHRWALKKCEQWGVQLPDKDLAYFPVDSGEGQEYLTAMDFCLRFAAENRARMMKQVVAALDVVKPGFAMMERINIHHNFARMENHYGENVMVHRKGATCVREGTLGIIPGSMGTSSYIVIGKGNPESFESCSHGAGRALGRKEACRKLNLEAEKAKMEGVVHGLRNASDLEEAPGAYKDIDEVMSCQMDLVEIRTKLRPIASMKG